jgi:hypothetical protein
MLSREKYSGSFCLNVREKAKKLYHIDTKLFGVAEIDGSRSSASTSAILATSTSILTLFNSDDKRRENFSEVPVDVANKIKTLSIVLSEFLVPPSVSVKKRNH